MMATVDGFDGEVVFEPSEEICSRARNRIRGETEKQQILQEMKGKENITVPANIKEFTSEQPDTSGAILQCIPNIADTADISIDFDFSSIQSYVFFPLHLLKDLLLFGFLTSPVPRPAADFL